MKNVLRAICVALLAVTPAAAATIDFEDAAAVAGGADVLSPDIMSGGFIFDSSGNHLHRVNGSIASNGSTNLGIHEFPGFNNIVTIRPVGGGVFSLNAIDFGEWLGTTPRTTILINGIGGTNPSTFFTLDGFVNGPIAPSDFETVTFDASWSNLTAVTLDGINGPFDINGFPLGSFVIDNIVVNTAVPEPMSIVLLGSGLVVAARRRLRRR